MQVIEAALAFAITMLVLSILCSTLVETVHRVFGMRENGFRKMIGELFDQVLAPYAGSDPDAKERFQERMSSIRSPVGLMSSIKTTPNLQTTWDKIYNSLATLWRGRGLSEQTVAGFMERLGADPVGQELVDTVRAAALAGGVVAQQAVDRALQGVAQKFDAFGKEATTFFERRARTISVIVAMLVAGALHVDAIDLFKTLMRNPDARAAVLATQDETLKIANRAQAAADSSAAAVPANLEDLKKNFNDAVQSMKDTEKKLSDLGVPIGWTDQRILEAKLVRVAGVPIPTNWKMLIGLLLGGLLVGLGGPFWSDTIAKITSIRQAANAIPAGVIQPAAVAMMPAPAVVPVAPAAAPAVVPPTAPAIAGAPPPAVVPPTPTPAVVVAPALAGVLPTLQPVTPVDSFKVAAHI
jgi:hypothetical protein